VPRLLVPDNAKVAVIKACLYEPQVNRTYAEMAAHYGTAVLPTRPHRPRDKAKVEAAVLIVERWILARLRGLGNLLWPQLGERQAAQLRHQILAGDLGVALVRAGRDLAFHVLDPAFEKGRDCHARGIDARAVPAASCTSITMSQLADKDA
jgi:hypothetical protein